MAKTIFGFPVVTSDDLDIALKDDSVEVKDWKWWARKFVCAECEQRDVGCKPFDVTAPFLVCKLDEMDIY